MRLVFLFVLALLFINSSSAQLDVKISLWSGTQLYNDGQKIKKSEFKDILSVNPKALNLANKGFGQQSVSFVFGFIGGGLIGWPLGAAIAGKDDPHWYLAGIGVGLTIASFTLYSSGGKKIKFGVDLYNEESIVMAYPKSKFQLISVRPYTNGIGLSLSF